MTNWNLLPDEKKIHLTKISRIVFFRTYAVSIILAVFALAFLAAAPLAITYRIGGFFAILLASVVPYFLAEKKRTREMVLITTQRVLIRKQSQDPQTGGTIEEETIPYDKLINVQVRQTRKQRLFKTGDVVFKLPGEEHTITDIHDPHSIERAIYKIIDVEKKRGMLA